MSSVDRPCAALSIDSNRYPFGMTAAAIVQLALAGRYVGLKNYHVL